MTYYKGFKDDTVTLIKPVRQLFYNLGIMQSFFSKQCNRDMTIVDLLEIQIVATRIWSGEKVDPDSVGHDYTLMFGVSDEGFLELNEAFVLEWEITKI